MRRSPARGPRSPMSPLAVRRTRCLAVLVLVLLGAGVPSASAKTTTFSATVSGTYRSEGNEVNDGCWQETADEEVNSFTQRNHSVEEDSFHSVAPITLTVSRHSREKAFDAGSFAHLPTRFAISRTDTREPSFCIPSDREMTHPDCGSRARTYRLRLYGRSDRPAFSFMFTRGYASYRPEDPFAECPLFGGRWIGNLEGSGPARASPRKLFARGPKKLVFHGGASGPVRDESGTATGSFELTWTLTLRRTRAGARAAAAPMPSAL